MSRTEQGVVRSGLAAIRVFRKAGFQRRQALLQSISIDCDRNILSLRDLYAPKSHRKQNPSKIARVIRALKVPIQDFVTLLTTQGHGFGEHT